jgi:uncharacterized protein (TIGR03086 family)
MTTVSMPNRLNPPNRYDLSDQVEVTEFTDPICSWAWGTEPKLRLLRWRHGHRLSWRTVMGGLIGDATAGRSDWDPVLAAKPMQDYWRRTSTYTGQPYPIPMRRMARSTDPAGRAVKAALLQSRDAAERVLRRLRESTFIFGTTPYSPDELAECVAGVPGLDLDRWKADLVGDFSLRAYQSDWAETRRPNDHVRRLEGDTAGIGSMKHSEGHDRYAFPTLIMNGPSGSRTVPGWMPYSAYEEAMEGAVPGSTDDPRPDPTAREAFERWGVHTARELAVLCGDRLADGTDSLPDDVIAHDWGGGLIYLTRAEAAARSLPRIAWHDAQALRDLIDVVESAVRLVGTFGGPDSVKWDLRTPCEAWNVRDLVRHMVGGTRMVACALRSEPFPTAGSDLLGSDPVGAFRRAIDEMVTTFRTDPTLLLRSLPLEWGDTPGSVLAEMFMADHLVHTWDLARSLSVDVPFDEALVARARRFADAYVPTRRGPRMFDEECAVPRDASPIERLVAFVGRDVSRHVLPVT